jgi:cytidylate kinase
MIVTIDGPVASGKSTVARLLAQRLGCYYINSGLLFRTCAYVLMRDGGHTSEQLRMLSDAQLAGIDWHQLHYVVDDGREQIIYANENITYVLKDEAVAQAASIAATNAGVRALVLAYERQLAHGRSCVIDGRDTGSVVFPNAEVKIYLSAAPEVRARRWQLDQEKHGTRLTLKRALDDVMQRDVRDKKRAIAPLTVPHNATVIDTSALSIAQVVDAIELLVKKS